MKALRRISAPAAVLMRDNVDTDAIIPAWILKRIGTDMGRIGEGLFGDWRLTAEGAERPGFVLNRPGFRDARILVTGDNFGCGSSREHAAWALAGGGFRVVLAKGFADIFRENAFRNGILAVTLPAAALDGVAAAVAAAPGADTVVDLEARTIRPPGGSELPFGIDPDRRAALLEGLGEIAATLRHAEEIAAFEAADAAARPWAAPRGDRPAPV